MDHYTDKAEVDFHFYGIKISIYRLNFCRIKLQMSKGVFLVL